LSKRPFSTHIILSFLCAILLSAIFLPQTAEARSLRMNELVYEAELLPDGSMSVTERITVTFNGTYEGYFVSIPLDSTTISDITVAEEGVAYSFNPGEDYGPPGTFLVKQDSNEMLVDWSIDATDEQRTFDLSYRVNNLVKVHNDVAEFYRKFVGEKNEQKIERVVVRLLLPPGAENFTPGTDIRIWGHGPLHGDVDFGGPREVIWQISDMPAGEFLEGRLTMPVQLFPETPAAMKTDRDALASILEEEEEWAAKANLGRSWARLEIVAAVILALLTIAALIWLWFRYGKRHRPEFQGDYYRELPADYPPAVMSVLWNWGKVKTHDVTATLMDLARRGFIYIEQQMYEKKRLLGNKNIVTYLLTLQNEKYEREKDGLQPHERKLIDYFFTTISKDNRTLYLYDIEQFSRKRSREFYYSFWVQWSDSLSSKGDQYKWFEGIPQNARWIPLVIGMASFALGMFLVNKDVSILGWTVCACAILVGLLPLFFKRRSRAASEDFSKWKAFRKFLLHFSEMQRHEIPSLIIWEHYLVYAVSLGVAREVMKQLEIVFPNLQDSDYRFGQHWYYGTATAGMISLGDNFEKIGQSLQQSIRAAERTVRAAESRSSSGSGGGGGFSGGGGGGSGGGSYGGR
jgi:uncharacterized membrane protein